MIEEIYQKRKDETWGQWRDRLSELDENSEEDIDWHEAQCWYDELKKWPYDTNEIIFQSLLDEEKPTVKMGPFVKELLGESWFEGIVVMERIYIVISDRSETTIDAFFKIENKYKVDTQKRISQGRSMEELFDKDKALFWLEKPKG